MQSINARTKATQADENWAKTTSHIIIKPSKVQTRIASVRASTYRRRRRMMARWGDRDLEAENKYMCKYVSTH